MMQVGSNIAEVLTQLYALRARVPVAKALALRAARWERPLRSLTRHVLMMLATPKQRHLVGPMADALTAESTATELIVRLIPPAADELWTDAELKRQQVAQNLAAGKPIRREDLLAAVTQWVETPVSRGGKRRDRRDAKRNADEIAEFITFVISGSPAAQLGRRAEAARKLLPHVAKFLTLPPQVQQGLDAATLERWLSAVLVAWEELIRSTWPEIFARELHA